MVSLLNPVELLNFQSFFYSLKSILNFHFISLYYFREFINFWMSAQIANLATNINLGEMHEKKVKKT